MIVKKGSLKPIPIHILLIGLYPLFFLWSANFDQIPVFALSRVLIFSLALIIISLLVSLLIFRNLHKAALFTSIFLLLFYLYGHIFPNLDKAMIFGFVIGRHRYILAIFIFILVICGIFLFFKETPRKLTYILNVSSALLFGIVLIQVIVPYITNPDLVKAELNAVNNNSSKPSAAANAATSQTPGRDVYYILLDGYGRQDLLRDEQGLDNSAFVQELTDLGFVVQECALSNYSRTPLSLGSSLNMNYLDNLGVQAGSEETHVQYDKLGDMLQHSLVRNKFEEMGYQFIAFKGVYTWLNIQDADWYVENEQYIPVLDRQETINFQYLFLRTSALMYLFDKQAAAPEDFEDVQAEYLRFIFPASNVFSTREYKQYQANLFALDRLKEMAKRPGKKFVYAHLYITHQPYVFNPDGSFRWPPLEDMNAYNDQVRFINPRMIDILKTIIHDSAVPPVIVIQGDHSFLLNKNRMKILNAYYLPENGKKALYPEITPANTFRLIFNTYFGMNYPLLEDHSYYSEGRLPYKFEEIPINCPPNN
jgi:hypothetical protein